MLGARRRDQTQSNPAQRTVRHPQRGTTQSPPVHHVRRRQSRQRVIRVQQVKQATFQQVEIEQPRLHIAPFMQQCILGKP